MQTQINAIVAPLFPKDDILTSTSGALQFALQQFQFITCLQRYRQHLLFIQVELGA